MGVLDRIFQAFTEPPSEFQLQQRSLESFEFTPLGEAIKTFRGANAEAWRPASVDEALGIPAIQRAVSLISNTTGSLSVEGLRNGVPMSEPPRIVQRPDPFQTPREFYRDSAFCLATRGEAVWWIAARDNDGLPASLIVVPLHELTIEKNPNDRRFPIYRWGKTVSTRFTPLANQTGEFVHITYLRKPGDLRGKGPLQYCGVAVSVTVEAQLWAANFFAGDVSAVELKSLVDIDETEANALREQWMERGATGTPRVTGPSLEWKDHIMDPESAQMVEARSHQDGEAARMFGIPGKLLEYAAPGSSLTYQNIAEVFTDFVRSCLSINYLEPIEQAMSDLLPRSTAARFNVEGLLRADIKTRFEVYEKAIAVFGPEEGAQYARVREGLSPGNIEMLPVPFAVPAAVPASFPEERSEQHPAQMFAEAMLQLATREQPIPQVTIHNPPITLQPAEVHVEPQITVEAPDMSGISEAIAGIRQEPAKVQVDVAAPDMRGVAEALSEMATRPQSPTEIHMASQEPPVVNVPAPIVNVPDQPVPQVNVDTAQFEQALDELRAEIRKPRRKTIVRDKNNVITGVVEESA